MTYAESVEYLLALLSDARGPRLGLERIRSLLGRLGQPQRSFRAVHVAGTNGKGSTAAMIEAGLRAAGHSTGLYTSPHLARFNERVRINGRDIHDEGFAAAVEEVRQANEWLVAREGRHGHASFFESVTATAFCALRRESIDWGVVEVGLGGRLDATNVLQPQLCVVTPIDFDHEEFLGKARASIATEKAGILKPGAKVVLAPQHSDAELALTSRAEEVGAPMVRVGRDWRAENITEVDGYYRFEATKMPSSNSPRTRVVVELSLAGEHQVVNALTAAAALDALGVEAAAISRGIKQTRWPGRIEQLSGEPPILLDSAHNAGGARALAKFLQRHKSGRPIHLIYGASRDKPVDEVAGILFPLARRVTLTRAQVKRSLRPQTLLSIADHHHDRIDLTPTLEAALAKAQANASADGLIVVTGSVFLVGEARELLRVAIKKGQTGRKEMSLIA